MRLSSKVALVAAGYLGALLVASAATAIRIAATSGPDARASSGMYAFGDSVLFIAAFGLLALVPTAAALYWLRPYRRFWVVLAAVGVGIAVTLALFAATAGELAVVVFAAFAWFVPLYFF